MFHNVHTRNKLENDIVLLTSSCNSFVDGYQEGLLGCSMPISASNLFGAVIVVACWLHSGAVCLTEGLGV